MARNKVFYVTLATADTWGVKRPDAPWNNQADTAVIATSRAQAVEFLHAARCPSITLGFLANYGSSGNPNPRESDSHLLDEPGVHARPDSAYGDPWKRITDGATYLIEEKA